MCPGIVIMLINGHFIVYTEDQTSKPKTFKTQRGVVDYFKRMKSPPSVSITAFKYQNKKVLHDLADELNPIVEYRLGWRTA